MKVFFVGSPRYLWKNQYLIYRQLEEEGYSHTSDYVLKTDPDTFYDMSKEGWLEHYKHCITALGGADFCVFEASTPSHAIGQLVQEALRKEKPVIALHTKDYKPFFMLGSAGNERRLQVLEYSKDTLRDVLLYASDVVKDLLQIRFTLLLDSTMKSKLDEVAEKGITRSEYIRNLIEKDMGK